MAKLIGMSGEFQNREYPLENAEVTIGRKSDNIILLDNPVVSSHHCVLTCEDGAFTIRDLGSTNGTRVNSRDVRDEGVELHIEGQKSYARSKFKEIYGLYDTDRCLYCVIKGKAYYIIPKEAPELGAVPSADYTAADAEVTAEKLVAPDNFTNISPFGARPKERLGTWWIVLIVAGCTALAALAWFFVRVFAMS